MKEQIRRDLLERYISTGRVGMTKPQTDAEAIDLIETVVELYEPTPTHLTMSDMTSMFKELLG